MTIIVVLCACMELKRQPTLKEVDTVSELARSRVAQSTGPEHWTHILHMSELCNICNAKLPN